MIVPSDDPNQSNSQDCITFRIAMASHDSIKRALLRPGHFLSLHSDRLLYVSPVRSLGGFSVLRPGSRSMAPGARFKPYEDLYHE